MVKYWFSYSWAMQGVLNFVHRRAHTLHMGWDPIYKNYVKVDFSFLKNASDLTIIVFLVSQHTLESNSRVENAKLTYFINLLFLFFFKNFHFLLCDLYDFGIWFNYHVFTYWVSKFILFMVFRIHNKLQIWRSEECVHYIAFWGA